MARSSDPAGSEGATVYPGGNWEAGRPPPAPVPEQASGHPGTAIPWPTALLQRHSARPRCHFEGDGWPRHGDSGATASASLRTGQKSRFWGPCTTEAEMPGGPPRGQRVSASWSARPSSRRPSAPRHPGETLSHSRASPAAPSARPRGLVCPPSHKLRSGPHFQRGGRPGCTSRAPGRAERPHPHSRAVCTLLCPRPGGSADFLTPGEPSRRGGGPG